MEVKQEGPRFSLKGWHVAAFGFVLLLVMKRMARKVLPSAVTAKGKTILITGANSGIGKAAATEFAKRGGRVIMACRDLDKAKDAVCDIRKKTNKGLLLVKQLNLASFKSVREFAEDITNSEDRLDVLVNNAGVMGVPFSLTEDGHETTFAINHLGHFLLTNLLLDLLKKSQPSRVVIISSTLYKYGAINFSDLDGKDNYDSSKAYHQSKLANILFTQTLSKGLQGSGVTVNSVSPGMVKTNLARNYLENSWIKKTLFQTIGRLILRSPKRGSETVVYCALNPDLQHISGRFFRDNEESKLMPHARDESVARKLWEVSERLTALRK